MDLLVPSNLDFAKPRCTLTESMLAGARAIILDNGVLRLSVLPEFGGRLCSLYYRQANLELLATEFLGGSKDLHVKGGWCAAFPSLLADGEQLTHKAWTVDVLEHTDARVAVRLATTVDQVSHMVGEQMRLTPGRIVITRDIVLNAGEPAALVEETLTNENAWPMPVVWSGVVSLRAAPGDRVVLPVDAVEVLSGVGPQGNELDFGLMVSTPYHALARNLREGWLGYRPGSAPVDARFTFPVDLLPHAAIGAHRHDRAPAENAFRLQPMTGPGPVADDTRGGALMLPVGRPVRLPMRLEIGSGVITGGVWSRPGLELANLIAGQRVPAGRVAIWRVGRLDIALKTSRLLALLLPDTAADAAFAPEDAPPADLIACGGAPAADVVRRLAARTPGRFIGPAELRVRLMADGVAEDRSVALSPGARFDLPGLGVLATPARREGPGERLGFLMQADHLTVYHAGPTQFLGEFGTLGESFHPHLVLLPLDLMSPSDALHAARQLQPRVVVPLGDPDAERQFIERCRAQHVPFAVQALAEGEGRAFDGYKLTALEA
jgi:hypothetical protein